MQSNIPLASLRLLLPVTTAEIRRTLKVQTSNHVSEPLPLCNSQAATSISLARYPRHLGFTLLFINCYLSLWNQVLHARLIAPRWVVEVDTGMRVEMGVDTGILISMLRM
jgi:hypothetical protein